MSLRDEGTYHLRVFVLMKEVRDGTYGYNLLLSKDNIYQPVISMLYWTIMIQFFPKSGRFPPHISCLLELLLDHGI